MATPIPNQTVLQQRLERTGNFAQYGAQLQSPVPSHPAQHLLQQQQIDHKSDPIFRVKQNVKSLKDALSNVLLLASKFIYYNSVIDSGIKPQELSQQRFDKALEEFYAVCDQIESNLRLAAECQNQVIDSNRHTSLLATAAKTDQTSQYVQYLSTVRSQIHYAKEVHDVLLECVTRSNTKTES